METLGEESEAPVDPVTVLSDKPSRLFLEESMAVRGQGQHRSRELGNLRPSHNQGVVGEGLFRPLLALTGA